MILEALKVWICAMIVGHVWTSTLLTLLMLMEKAQVRFVSQAM